MWWIVANDKDPEHGWHWDQFFDNPGDPEENFDWGGPEWVRSTASFGRIERMRKGDPFVAYQSDEGVVGFGRLGSNGRLTPSSGNFDSFDLAPSPVLRLSKAVPYEVIRDLPDSKRHFEFVKFHQGTVFAMTEEGQTKLLSLASQFNPSQSARIGQFGQSHAA
jgi:hypothetical protein